MSAPAAGQGFSFPQAVVDAVAKQRNDALDTVAMQAATIAHLKLQLGQAEARIEKLSNKPKTRAKKPAP